MSARIETPEEMALRLFSAPPKFIGVVEEKRAVAEQAIVADRAQIRAALEEEADRCMRKCVEFSDARNESGADQFAGQRDALRAFAKRLGEP